jgi:hypothetical protein
MAKQKTFKDNKTKKKSVRKSDAKSKSGCTSEDSYPRDELYFLHTLTGKAKIQGVQFDLSPEQLVLKGWMPILHEEHDPFHESGLQLPWSPKAPKRGPLKVLPGDIVKIASITTEKIGDELAQT